VLEVATNDARLIRGRSAVAVLGSECCYWRTDEHSSSNDEEVVAAAEPSMSMCPDGGLLMLGSSVYRKLGFMYRQYRALHGNETGNPEDICWFAPSSVMNPRLPAKIIDKALADNPARARAEYLNVWREEGDDLFALDLLERCTDYGAIERPPRRSIRYFCYSDPASGTGKDSYALAIGHVEFDQAQTVWLDVVRERKPPFSPSAVIAEFVPLLRQYGITEVIGDRYAVGFHIDEWQRNGFVFKPCERTTSENYLGLLPLLLSGRGRLTDTAIGRSQLASLERIVQSGGRETVRHPQVDSAHDDVAAVIAGAMVLAGNVGQASAWMQHCGAAAQAIQMHPPHSRYARRMPMSSLPHGIRFEGEPGSHAELAFWRRLRRAGRC
jgi:hypothetical protein